jgi:high-affinity nickel-transport protein
MTGSLALAVVGFFLGMRHATDPDHVIAVTTFVAREKTASGAAAIGAAWGFGHTLTILVVGSGIILFEWVIPPRVGLSMEFSVGLMLIVLGVMNLKGMMRLLGASRQGRDAVDQPFHPHSHGDYVRPLMVGVVHGLAGSAAVALLVLAAIPDPRWGFWYLLVFGLGTMAGMMLMTAAIVLPFAKTDARFARLGGGVRIASGVISLGFGLFVAYRTGFTEGLFTGVPRWTPN